MFSQVVISTISVYLVITLIGWFGNINIVIATVRNRNLRNPCNLLIAVRSICDVFSRAANLVTAYFIYTGDYFTSLHNCMRLQFVPNIFMQFSIFHTLIIGIDRIFGVCCRSRYEEMRKTTYVIGMMIPGAMFSALQLTIAYYNAVGSNIQVICTTVAIYTNISLVIMVTSHGILNIISVLVYAIMWMLVRKQGSAFIAATIIKTLLLVVTFDVLAWLMTVVAFSTTVIFHMEMPTAFYISLFASFFVNIGAASNFFLLYCICGDYRHAFRRQLRLILPGMKKIHVTSQNCAVTTVSSSALRAFNRCPCGGGM